MTIQSLHVAHTLFTPLLYWVFSISKSMLCSRLGWFVNICGVSAIRKVSLSIRVTELKSLSSCKLITTTRKTAQSVCPSDRTLLPSVKIKGVHLGAVCSPLVTSPLVGKSGCSKSRWQSELRSKKKESHDMIAAAEHSSANHVAPGHLPTGTCVKHAWFTEGAQWLSVEQLLSAEQSERKACLWDPIGIK